MKISNTNNEGLGIDLGIKEFAVCSDGIKFKNINKTSIIKKVEKNLKTTPRLDCALNALAIDEPLEYARLYLDGTMQMWVDAEDSFYL